VAEPTSAGAVAVAIDQRLADLEPDHEPRRVPLGQLERELGVGAAELDLDSRTARRRWNRLGPHFEVRGPERVDVLPDVPHRGARIANPPRSGHPERTESGLRRRSDAATLSRSVGMPEPHVLPVTRRLAAELELARAVHGLTIHELGNPLQSLLVLIELTRDELCTAGVGGRSVERLDRALASVERLRRVLLGSGAVRASLDD